MKKYIFLCGVLLCVFTMNVKGQEIKQDKFNQLKTIDCSVYMEHEGKADPFVDYKIPDITRGEMPQRVSLSEDTIEPVSLSPKYDPRENKVSLVKNQFGGTCWAYAAIAVAETNLIKKGYTGTNVDLSECATTYFANSGKYYDPLELYHNKESSESMYELVWKGGVSESAYELYSRWKGLVLEADAPFTGEANDKYNVNGLQPKLLVADKEYYHLNGTRYCNYYAVDDIQRNNPSVEQVKDLIEKYGGVSISYYNKNANAYMNIIKSTSYKAPVAAGFMNYDQYDYVYYFPHKGYSTNHAVEIVGWDDSFSKDKFATKPEKDGAWLVKQSWGGGCEADGAAYTYMDEVMTGYMWLSYYDKSITNVRTLELERKDKYANQYYWGESGTSKNTFFNQENNSKNVVFIAKAYQAGTEKIDAVMVGLDAQTEYEITAYVNPKYVDQELVAFSGKSNTLCGENEYSGYYTLPFSTPAYISEGDSYSIECKIKNKDPEQACYSLRGLTNKASGVIESTDVYVDKQNIVLTDNEKETKITATVLPMNATHRTVGYYLEDDDIAKVNTNGLISAKKYGTTNLTIRSYDGKSRKKLPVTVACTEISADTIICYIGEEIQLQINTDMQGVNVENFTYECANTQVATVSETGKVKAIKEGNTAVVITYKNELGNLIRTRVSIIVKPKIMIESITTSQAEGDISITEESSIFLNVIASSNQWNNAITVTSSNPSVAMVNSVSKGAFGNYNGGFAITPLTNGRTTIELRSTDGSNIVKRWTVSVQKKTDESFTPIPYAPQPTYNPVPVDTQLAPLAYYNGTVTVKGYTYKLSNGVATVNGVTNKKAKSVTVAGSVIYNNVVYPITSINKNAFKGMAKLSTVTIGANVEKIGAKAFYNCKELKKVTIKTTKLKSVGSSAFKKLKAKATISVPKASKKAYSKLFKGKCDKDVV